MVAETAAIRAMAGSSGASTSALLNVDFTFTGAGKGRSPEATGKTVQPPPNKGPGRPTSIDILGRDRTQSTIESLFPVTVSRPTLQSLNTGVAGLTGFSGELGGLDDD